MLLTNCMIKRSCKSKETASDGLEKERAAQLNLQERRLCWPCEEPEKGDYTTGIVCRTSTSSHWIKMLCLTKKCEVLQK
nr:uncharacterized protein LOC110362295 isoform X4 [Columba livia]